MLNKIIDDENKKQGIFEENNKTDTTLLDNYEILKDDIEMNNNTHLLLKQETSETKFSDKAESEILLQESVVALDEMNIEKQQSFTENSIKSKETEDMQEKEDKSNSIYQFPRKNQEHIVEEAKPKIEPVEKWVKDRKDVKGVKFPNDNRNDRKGRNKKNNNNYNNINYNNNNQNSNKFKKQEPVRIVKGEKYLQNQEIQKKEEERKISFHKRSMDIDNKIETNIQHNIINTNKFEKKMVDNFCQTDKKSTQSEESSANIEEAPKNLNDLIKGNTKEKKKKFHLYSVKPHNSHNNNLERNYNKTSTPNFEKSSDSLSLVSTKSLKYSHYKESNENFEYNTDFSKSYSTNDINSPHRYQSCDDNHKSKQVNNNFYIINSSVNINNYHHNYDSRAFNFNSYYGGYNYINNNYVANDRGSHYHHEKSHPKKADKKPTIQHCLMTKIDPSIFPFIYYYRLHNDILDYSKEVMSIIEALKDIKISVIRQIEKIIREFLPYSLDINVYGSFATDLSIESSDVDITIKFKDSDCFIELDGIINKICEIFHTVGDFDTINPIYTASVPIIKIVCDPEKTIKDEAIRKKFKAFKNSTLFKNYKFDIEEISKIKVDLTFLEMCNNVKYQNTKETIEWANNTMKTYPEVKPLIHVLKRYLQIMRLNSSFNGLASYSLFLMVVALAKYNQNNSKLNLGRLLFEFLEIYGKFFNYAQCTINVNAYNPFIVTNEYSDSCPTIIDPLTSLNVAKNSFRVEEVREAFSEGYDYLNNCKIQFDKKDLLNSINLIRGLLFNSSNPYK